MAFLPWVPFPEWMVNGEVIGVNPDGEQLALAINKGAYTETFYLFRLAKLNNCWVTVRPATEQDVKAYDAIFLRRLRISMVDLNAKGEKQ